VGNGAPPQLRTAALSRLPRIEMLLLLHPQTLDGFRELRLIPAGLTLPVSFA
jgi:hypothetical protein